MSRQIHPRIHLTSIYIENMYMPVLFTVFVCCFFSTINVCMCVILKYQQKLTQNIDKIDQIPRAKVLHLETKANGTTISIAH